MFKKLLGILPMLCLAGFGLKAQCPAASAGPDDTVCVNSTATLAATLPAEFSGRWRRVGTTPAGTITNDTIATSTVTGLTAAGNLRLIWTITGPGNCSSFDTVTIVVSPIPTVGGFNSNVNAGTDRTICTGGTAALDATLPVGSNGLWTRGGGVNAATTSIATPTSDQTEVTGFNLPNTATGRDTLVWTVTNPSCSVTVSDRVVVTVNAAPSPANGGPDRSKCEDDTLRLIGSPNTSGTASWSLPFGTTVASFFPGTSGNNDTVLIQGNSGTVKIAYRIANGSTSGQNPATIANGCLSTDTVTLSFGPSANAGPDQNICLNNISSVTLAAVAAPSGTTGRWSFVKKEGNEVITDTTSATSTITGITSDTLILRWTVRSATCTSTDDVAIRITQAPSAANAGQNRTGCVNDTLQLIGSVPTIGTPSWALSAGGSQSGIGFVPNSSAGRNNDTVRVRLVTAGTYNLVYTLTNGASGGSSGCVSRDTLSITVNPAPSANAGPDQSYCNGTSFTVSGNRPSGFASGTWSIVGGTPGTITPINDTAATVSGVPTGETTLRWTVRNTFGCSASNDMDLNVNTTPTTAIAGPDRTGCIGDTLRLIGNAPTNGNPSWAISGGNGITFVPPFNGQANDTVLVRLAAAGNYNLVYTIRTGTAGSSSSCTSRDTLRITVNAAPVANAGPDQSICGTATSTIIGGNRPVAPATGIWSIVGSTQGTLALINDTASSISNLPLGTTTLAWTVSVPGGCSATDLVNIVLGAAPNASAGADVVSCANDTIRLIGTATTVGQTATWTRIGNPAGGGPSFITSANNDTVRLVVRGSGNYSYVYTVSVGEAGTACTSRDTLVIMVNPAPVANIVTSSQMSCKEDSVYTLSASRPVAPLTGTWSLVGTSAALLTPTDTSARVANLPVGVTTVRWSVTGPNGCDASDNVTITRNAAPTPANAGPDRQACTVSTIVLPGNTPTAGTSSWAIVNSNLATLVGNPNNDTATVQINGTGTIRLRYRISNGSTNPNTGCVSNDTIVVIASACTGIDLVEAETAVTMSVHPNPATQSIHVSFKDAGTGMAELTILSLDGRKVMEEPLGSAMHLEKEINISSLTKGVYIVSVKRGNDTGFTRLVIQ